MTTSETKSFWPSRASNLLWCSWNTAKRFFRSFSRHTQTSSPRHLETSIPCPKVAATPAHTTATILTKAASNLSKTTTLIHRDTTPNPSSRINSPSSSQKDPMLHLDNIRINTSHHSDQTEGVIMLTEVTISTITQIPISLCHSNRTTTSMLKALNQCSSFSSQRRSLYQPNLKATTIATSNIERPNMWTRIICKQKQCEISINFI